jgi:molybdopterin synthase catalytic subunit
MDLNTLMAKVKAHPRFNEAGMVLIHNGVVRNSSRDGKAVTGLKITVDDKRLQEVLSENRARPGIVDIQVDIARDRDLTVGDDVMYIVVAGDIRENVIDTLRITLDTIKREVTHKVQYFKE